MFRHGMTGGWWCGTGGFFPGPLGMLASILFWGLLIYLAVKIGQSIFFSGQKGENLHNDNALDLLKKRYALGEINQEEFEKIRREIRE
ncbi:MAG: SHOCT domain-containing protein [Proteobacteria bacterium]|nr:SHOCT domain-containing protein [Pseudomonadota bacterium]MBU1058549.1 SHOCT domain-containing protein [Pseudomonadota bacterium]